MKGLRKAAAAATIALGCVSAPAMNVGPAMTYSKLVWTVSLSAPALVGCQQLIFDATGDLVNSDTLGLAGALNCYNGGYGMTGSLYMAIDGSLNISMVSAGYSIVCPRVVGWFGNCTVFDSAGVQRGTGFIRLL